MALPSAYGEVNANMKAEMKISLLYTKVKDRPKPTATSYSEKDTNIIGSYLSATSSQYSGPKSPR